MVASLYFHVPFCTKKCPYCHFYVTSNALKNHSLFLEAVLLEWERKKTLLEGCTIQSIYFGGGTPSLLGPDALGKLLQTLQNGPARFAPHCEITLEANPEKTSFSLWKAFRETGINRLSLGVQSLDEMSLDLLGRTHSARQAQEALWNATKAGFDNISIDLMYDLPSQTLSSWLATLEQLPLLPLTHLSLYNLTIEPKTAFFRKKLSNPSASLSYQMLQSALQLFAKMDLERYEISAFCKDGKRSAHNLGYWTNRPFLGFGPSAHSFWDGERFSNVSSLTRYAQQLHQGKDPCDFREKLSEQAQTTERLVLALRVKEGVDLERFPPLPLETQQTLETLRSRKWIERQNHQIFLTEQGRLFYDTLASELI